MPISSIFRTVSKAEVVNLDFAGFEKVEKAPDLRCDFFGPSSFCIAEPGVEMIVPRYFDVPLRCSMLWTVLGD